jgi:hypothetical protein
MKNTSVTANILHRVDSSLVNTGDVGIEITDALFVGGANLRFKLRDEYTRGRPYPYTIQQQHEYPDNGQGYTIPIIIPRIDNIKDVGPNVVAVDYTLGADGDYGTPLSMYITATSLSSNVDITSGSTSANITFTQADQGNSNSFQIYKVYGNGNVVNSVPENHIIATQPSAGVEINSGAIVNATSVNVTYDATNRNEGTFWIFSSAGSSPFANRTVSYWVNNRQWSETSVSGTTVEFTNLPVEYQGNVVRFIIRDTYTSPYDVHVDSNEYLYTLPKAPTKGVTITGVTDTRAGEVNVTYTDTRDAVNFGSITTTYVDADGDPISPTPTDDDADTIVVTGLTQGSEFTLTVIDTYSTPPYGISVSVNSSNLDVFPHTVAIYSIDLASVFSEYGNVRHLMGIHHINDTYTVFSNTAFFVIGEDNASHYDGITGTTLEVQYENAIDSWDSYSRNGVFYQANDNSGFASMSTLINAFGRFDDDTGAPDNALTGFGFLSTVAVTTRRLTYTVKKSDATTNAYTRNSITLDGIPAASQFEVYVRSALSADGNTLLIASEDNDANIYGGYVYVYRRSGTDFDYEGDLSKYDNVYPYEFYSYGMVCALSADGNTALVSGSGNSNIGTAYIWEYDGSSWSDTELPAPQSAISAHSNYGISCALSVDGSAALVSGHGGRSVSARFDAYLWMKKRDGSGWVIDKHFENPSNIPYLGWRCALSGDGTVVLFTGFDDTNTGGYAYIHWKQSDGTWSNQDLSVDNVNGAYGYACALSADGKVALITGHGRVNYKYKTGTAWVWKFDGTDWYKDASLSRQDVSTYYGLSCSLSADGSIAMICGKASAANQNGQVYFWKDNGTSWSVISQHDDLLSSTGKMGTHCSLSASGEYGIVTEQMTNVGSTCKLYQFKLDESSTITSVDVRIQTKYATYSNVENSFNRVLYWKTVYGRIDDDSPFTNTYLNFGNVFGDTTTVHAQLNLSASANVLGNVWMFGVNGSDSDEYSNIALQYMVEHILSETTIQTDYVTLNNVDFDLYLNDITLGNVFSAIDGSPTSITNLAANPVNAVIVALEGDTYHAAYKNTSAGLTKTLSWIPSGYTLKIHFEAESSRYNTLMNKADVSQSFVDIVEPGTTDHSLFSLYHIHGYLMHRGCISIKDIRGLHEGVVDTSKPFAFSAYTIFTVSHSYTEDDIYPTKPRLFSYTYTHPQSLAFDEEVFSISIENQTYINIWLLGRWHTLYSSGINFNTERSTTANNAKIFLLYVSAKRVTSTLYNLKLKIWNIEGDTPIANVSIDSPYSPSTRYFSASGTYNYSIGGNGTSLKLDNALYGIVFEHKLYEGILDDEIDTIASSKIAWFGGSNIVDMTPENYIDYGNIYTFDRASLFKDDTYGYNSVADGSGTLNYYGTVAIVTKPVFMPDSSHPSNTDSNGGRAYIWKNFNNQWYHTNSLHDLSITDDLTFMDTHPHYHYRNYGKMCSLTLDGETAIVLSDYRITVWDYDGSKYNKDTINIVSLTLSDFDVRRHKYMWCVIKKLTNNDLVILASGNYDNQYGFMRIFKKSAGSTTWNKLVDDELYYNQGSIGTACDISDDGLVVLVTGPGIGQFYIYSDTSYTTQTYRRNFYTDFYHATYNTNELDTRTGRTLGWRCKLSEDGNIVLLGSNGYSIVRWNNVITNRGFLDSYRDILYIHDWVHDWSSNHVFNNFSMSNDGNRLLVNVGGASYLDPLLFERSGIGRSGNWTLINKLSRPTGERTTNYGYGTTLCVLSGDGTAALIGSQYETGNGSPYIFGNIW